MLKWHFRVMSEYFYLPCFIMTVRNLTVTFEHGRIRTWRFPRFSALQIDLRASAKAFIRTILTASDSEIQIKTIYC